MAMLFLRAQCTGAGPPSIYGTSAAEVVAIWSTGSTRSTPTVPDPLGDGRYRLSATTRSARTLATLRDCRLAGTRGGWPRPAGWWHGHVLAYLFPASALDKLAGGPARWREVSLLLAVGHLRARKTCCR